MLLQLTKPAPPEEALGRLLGERLLTPESAGSGGNLSALAGWAAQRAAELAEPRAGTGESTPQAAVVTLGAALEAEVRRLFREGHATKALLLDSAGNLVLAAATREVCRRLNGTWLSLGCHGLPLSLMPELAADAGRQAGVRVLPGGMLFPEKTVVGLVVSELAELPAGCRRCTSEICPWRSGGEP